MKLDFSRAAFVAAVIDLAIMAAASSLAESSWPEIQSDVLSNDVQTLASSRLPTHYLKPLPDITELLRIVAT